MIDYQTSFTNTNGVAFPGTLAVNATGPSTTDGTEFVKLFIDDLWGARQALMDYASLTPNSVTEGPGASQVIEAIQKGNAVGPGKYVWWGLQNTPSVTGDRVILLTPGATQGVLRATYGALDSAVYVGDGNNATAPYFYHADDAAGTTRNPTGIYLILPPSQQFYLKQYSESAGDFTVTGTNWTTTRAVAVPYQTSDGAWRIKFNIVGDLSVAATTLIITISGVTFKNVAGYSQAVSFSHNDGDRQYKSWAIANTGQVLVNINITVSTDIGFSGDVELDAAPSWINGFNYKLGITY